MRLRIADGGRRIWRRATNGAPWLIASLALLLLFASPRPLRAQPSADPATQPRDITGPEEPPVPPPTPYWPYWLAASLLGAACVSLIAWRLARRRPRSAPLPPDRWALQEIDRIAGLKLPGSGQTERFHTLLSDVIRRYVDLRYDLRAPRQTTPEFLKSLTEQSPLPAERQAKLTEFLRRCDVAKFAPVVPSVEESQEVLELARAIVQEESMVGSA